MNEQDTELELRKSCTGCPALEEKEGKPFCFYYQSYVDINVPCGNVFTEKPDKTQDQLHDEFYAKLERDYAQYPELMDMTPEEHKEWEKNHPEWSWDS